MPQGAVWRCGHRYPGEAVHPALAQEARICMAVGGVWLCEGGIVVRASVEGSQACPLLLDKPAPPLACPPNRLDDLNLCNVNGLWRKVGRSRGRSRAPSCSCVIQAVGSVRARCLDAPRDQQMIAWRLRVRLASGRCRPNLAPTLLSFCPHRGVHPARHLRETGCGDVIDNGLHLFKLHDFGFRGVSSVESAATGGVAHLVNFRGSDTMVALSLAREYYAEDRPGPHR